MLPNQIPHKRLGTEDALPRPHFSKAIEFAHGSRVFLSTLSRPRACLMNHPRPGWSKRIAGSSPSTRQRLCAFGCFPVWPCTCRSANPVQLAFPGDFFPSALVPGAHREINHR